MAIANQLHSAHHALADKLMGRQDLPEQYTLDLFYQSVKSSSDVQDFILRTAARLNLPIKWLPDRIAEQNFNLEEPPTKASAWVAVLLNQHLKVFRELLSTMPMLSTADVDQVGSSLSTFCYGSVSFCMQHSPLPLKQFAEPKHLSERNHLVCPY
jgi:hypothetical protein